MFVDERIKFLSTISSGVSEYKLKLFVLKVNRRVKHLLPFRLMAKEVVQTVLGKDLLSIVVEGETFV